MPVFLGVSIFRQKFDRVLLGFFAVNEPPVDKLHGLLAVTGPAADTNKFDVNFGNKDDGIWTVVTRVPIVAFGKACVRPESDPFEGFAPTFWTTNGEHTNFSPVFDEISTKGLFKLFWAKYTIVVDNLPAHVHRKYFLNLVIDIKVKSCELSLLICGRAIDFNRDELTQLRSFDALDSL